MNKKILNQWPKTYEELKLFIKDCNLRKKIVVSEENGLKHIYNNSEENLVLQIKIDGDMWTKGQAELRADYLVADEDTKIAYLIELKGHDIKQAIKQIQNTDTNLRTALSVFEKHWRIVYKSNTLKLRSNEKNNLKRKFPNLEMGEKIFTDPQNR